jgi:hypothetical protein
MMPYLNFLARLKSKNTSHALAIKKVNLLVIFIIYLGFNVNSILIKLGYIYLI